MRTAIVPPRPSASSRLCIIVALGVEHACLASVVPNQNNSVELVQCGQGAIKAADAAEQAVRAGATALLSIGLAGALDTQLRSGDVVVPDGVKLADSAEPTLEMSRAWTNDLRACLQQHYSQKNGLLLSVPHVLRSSSERAPYAQSTGAVACDMEAAAIAIVAKRLGVEMATIKVISDTATEQLPDSVESWVDRKGNSRLLPVLGTLMQPQQWPALGRLVRGYSVARRALVDVALRLSNDRWCLSNSR